MENKKFIPALKYDWLTRFYDSVVSTLMPEKRFKQALIDQASLMPGYSVLDFGCGTLTLSLMATEKCPDANFYAIDVDKQILSIAEKKLTKSTAQFTLLHYDGHTLPFGNGYFDKVVSSLVFHHLSREQKRLALSEIFRILKPGGELHIADWGKANSSLMRGAFYIVQLLDGFKTTTDNVKGLLPEYINQAGFKDVTETRSFRTILGTLSLYKGTKFKYDESSTH